MVPGGTTKYRLYRYVLRDGNGFEVLGPKIGYHFCLIWQCFPGLVLRSGTSKLYELKLKRLTARVIEKEVAFIKLK